MQDERTRLISPCLKAGVLRRDLIKLPPHRLRVLRPGEKDAPAAYGATRCLAYVRSRGALRDWRTSHGNKV